MGSFVDLETGKIYGCKKGSKVWWHEKGHLVFNKTELGTKINYYHYFFNMIAVTSLSFALLFNWLPLKLFALTNVIGMIGSWSYEEVWCWIYAFKNYKR